MDNHMRDNIFTVVNDTFKTDLPTYPKIRLTENVFPLTPTLTKGVARGPALHSNRNVVSDF